jgi:hypothetical protein
VNLQGGKPVADSTVRFVHAGELNLGAPLFGIGGLPFPLRSLMVNARYRAAERVFDTALQSNADFVLLTGGILCASGGGPRPCWFLAEQFARLAEHGIPVYWFEPPIAGNPWSDYVPRPANVFIAVADSDQRFEHRTPGKGAAIIAAGDACIQLSGDSAIPQIAVLPEGLDGLPLSPVGVDYWALGGRTSAGVAPSLCGLAQFSGTTQGHSPDDTGPRGCELVTIDRRRRCSSEFIETASVRWHEERVRVAGNLDWSELREQLLHRQERLLKQMACDLVMIRWTLTGRGALWQQLRREEVCRQLQAMLVRQARDRQPAAWSFVIDLLPDAEQLEVWSSDESPFGEAVRSYRAGRPDPAAMSPGEPHFRRVSDDASRLAHAAAGT